MRRDKDIRQLALQVSIALSAGVFSIMPSVSAAPVVDNVVSGGAVIDQTSPQVTDITSTTKNNVIDWRDFSVSQGETVCFDEGKHTNNYLNVVTGPNTSQIDGAIQGGANVYIVNPNGVVFGESASVDVGALYVSTRDITDTVKANFAQNGTNPLQDTSVVPGAEIVNMGTVQANSVFMEGSNIKFVLDNTEVTENEYNRVMLVNNEDGLTNVNQNLSGKNILTKDLDFDEASYTPIGSSGNPFTGTFDGQFHIIKNITYSGEYGGLFGTTNGATIKNVGVSGGKITASEAGGGIVGEATSTTFNNVFNEGTQVIGTTKNKHLGGIVGDMIGGTIETAYNTGTIGITGGSYTGGIAGQVETGAAISHVYNTGVTPNGIVGAKKGTACSITDAYTTTANIHGSYANGITVEKTISSASSHYVADYTGKLSSISNQGYDGNDENDTVWRIYEGQSLPLLRAFLKGHGVVNVNYQYAQGKNTGTQTASDLTVEYNGSDIALSNINYTKDGEAFTPTSKIITAPENDTIDGDITDKNYDSAKGKVRTVAAFYTSQQGYDLVGNNYTITQKAVTIDSTSVTTAPYSREYDGTNDAKDAVKNFSYGGANGIVAGDIEKGKVSIDTSSINAYFVGDKGNITDADAPDAGGDKKIAIIGGVTIANGSGYYNYKLTGDSATLGTDAKPLVYGGNTITQKAIEISLKNKKNIDKEYDGKTEVKDDYEPSIQITNTADGVGTGDLKQTINLDLSKAEAHYVDDDDAPTKMAGTYNDKVKYSGIKIGSVTIGSKTAKASNYKLVVKNADNSETTIYSQKVTGLDDSGVNETYGGSIYGSGTISRRNISSTGFYLTEGDATRPYNGKVSFDEAKNKTVSNAQDNSTTGLLKDDVVVFTVNSAEFVTSATDISAGTTKNVNTDTQTGAQGVRYTVTVSGKDAGNYTLNGNDLVTKPQTVIGAGTITPRELQLAVGSTKAIKDYDGDAAVKVKESENTMRTALTLDDGFLTYADAADTAHHLLEEDNSSIVITGSYLKTLNDAAAKDVNYSVTTITNPNETTQTYATADKNITYTAKVYEKVNGNNVVSENYVFSTSNKATADFTVNNGGKINPATITGVTFAPVSKTYDGKVAVTNTTHKDDSYLPLLTDDRITITAVTGLVGNETIGDLFGGNVIAAGDDGYQLQEDSTLLTGKYGTLNNGVFKENAHVARDLSGNVIARDVQYSGLSNILANRNYTLSSDISETAYGVGTINAFTITDASWIVLSRNNTPITKVYDGSDSLDGYTTNGTAVSAITYLNNLGTTEKPSYAYISPDNGTTKLDATATVVGAKYESSHSKNTEAQNVTYLVTVENTGDYTLSTTITNDAGQVEKVLVKGGNITPKAITIEDSDIVHANVTKEYDSTKYVGGDNASAVSGESLLTFADQMIANDGNANATTAEYNTAYASTVSGDKKVTYALTINGTDPSDYYFQNGDGTKITTYTGAGTIDKRLLTVSFGDVTDVYSGKSDVTATITPTVDNALASDKAGIQTALANGLKGIYGNGNTDATFVEDANYGLQKSVQYSNLNTALGNTYGANYKFASDTGYGNGSITKATIGMSNLKFTFADVKKTYDAKLDVGDKAADYVTGHYIDLGGGNHVDFDYDGITSAKFTTADAGSNKTVTYTISGIKIPQAVSNNFEFDTTDPFVTSKAYSIDLVGTITPKDVYASIVNPTVSKTYNSDVDVLSGSTKLSGESLVHISGLEGNSNNTSSASYTDKNHGSDKDVIYTLSISDGGNYYIHYDSNDANADQYDMGYANPGSDIISTVTTHNNIINQAKLALTFDDVEKYYDGTTAVAKTDVKEHFSGLQKSDSVTLKSYEASYNSPDVATADTITYDNILVEGNDDGNYVLVNGSDEVLGNGTTGGVKTTGKGTINKYILTQMPTFTIHDVTKEYDATEAVKYNRKDITEDADAIKKHFVNVTNLPSGVAYEVTKAEYQGANRGENKTVNFDFKLSGANYDFSQLSGLTVDGDGNATFTQSANDAEITARRVHVDLKNDVVIDKVYDGTPYLETEDAAAIKVPDKQVYMPVADDILEADRDSVHIDWGNLNAEYMGKDAGDNVGVKYTISLTNNAAGNYELYTYDVANPTAGTAITATAPLMGTGKISKADLVVNIKEKDKAYDGSSAIGLTAGDITLTGVAADGVIAFTDEVVSNNINGNYGTTDSTVNAFKNDSNVSWQGNGWSETNVKDKPILYTGLANALQAMVDADANSVFKNYNIADTAYFTAAQAKGKIKPIAITNAAVENWVPITREYDATTDVYGVAVADPSGGVLKAKDILSFTVKDDNGNIVTDENGHALALDYTISSANFSGKDVSDKHTLNYAIDKVTKGVSDKEGHTNYVLDDDVVSALEGHVVSSSDNNSITPRQLDAHVIKATGNNKTYDGTGVADASNFALSDDDLAVIAKDNALNNANVTPKITAEYTNLNASTGVEDRDINYTLKLETPNSNYVIATPNDTATGTIARAGLSIVATPVSVNVGDALPVFSGKVTGFVNTADATAYAGLVDGTALEWALGTGVTTAVPGRYAVYGWYADAATGNTEGNLGMNYYYKQSPANATAFTVNYVNSNTGNPDTKITPNNSIYHQISKDMNSGFGDNGAAAIEYKDKSGKVLGTEKIDSGEINGKGLMIGGGTDMSKQADSNANIGIAGGDIVNMEGANAAGSVNIETNGEGTVVNLEAFSVDEEKKSGTNNSTAEITNMDSQNGMASIEIRDEKQNMLGEDIEDKKEEKEGKIAIKSSNGEDDDEIELTVEKQGVNVA